MVWFNCDSCGDSIKKPKVQQHMYQCAAHSLTCVDCSRTFDRQSYSAHNTCVTESQKYAEGATKPGGFASKGFFEAGGGQAPMGPAAAGNPMEDEFLAKRPPWKCSVCNVSCTSQETLHGHASGKKHMRRAQAARSAASGGEAASAAAVQNGSSSQSASEKPAVNGSASSAAANGSSPAAAPNDSGPAAADTPKAAAQQQPKWKKLAATALKANGGVMKISKLQKSVLKASMIGTDASKASLKAEMLSKWRTSSQFEVDEESSGQVKLRS